MLAANAEPSGQRIAIAMRDLGKNSGAARNLQEQCAIFRDLGLAVDIYCQRVNRRVLDLAGARVHRIRRWPCDLTERRRAFDTAVRRRLRRHPPALFISHGDVRTRDVLFMHNCTHLAHELIEGTPLPPDDPLGRLHAHLVTEPGLALVVANSRLMARDLESRFALPPARVQVLYQGYSARVFNTADHAALRAAGRRRLGLDADRPLVGLITSGNFRKRNVDGLLRAARLAPPDVQWLIVGKDREQEEYKALARELGVADRVRFEPFVHDVHLHYHALDLFVLPAHIEEFGRAALEAMACGTPALLGPNVGCSELLEGDAAAGVLADIEPDTIASGVEALLADGGRLEAAGAAAAAIAARHTDHHQGRTMLRLLRSRLPGDVVSGLA